MHPAVMSWRRRTSPSLFMKMLCPIFQAHFVEQSPDHSSVKHVFETNDLSKRYVREKKLDGDPMLQLDLI